jgi:two-component system, sensor histidine kinase RegB
MAAIQDLERGFPGKWRPLRLETLVGLRWLAVAGQSIGVLFVQFVLGFPTPLGPCFGLIGLSVLLNIHLYLRYGAGDRLPARHAATHLVYDSLQLGGLLALTGGLLNPFSLLLLAPVSVSATTLPQRSTLLLAMLVATIATVISLWHLPLPWDPDRRIVFDPIYTIGIWVSLLCGVVFMTTYTNRVAHEARQLADALAATELALSRYEQLNALDGLAAAAAHELSTPLSTIALAAKEMLSEVEEGPLKDDVQLIIDQSTRCRAILAKLRNLGADGADLFASVPIGDLLAEVARPHEDLGRRITIETRSDGGPDPVFPRHVSLLYGLGNLIENAAQFARSTVAISAEWTASSVTVTILDDGPGYSPEVLARLGEPYLTTRAKVPTTANAAESGGLGLGIFIAKTLLERSGARIGFQNASPAGHAQVRIVWPRETIEAGRRLP